MQFDGRLVLGRSRTEVWQALNDPEVLQSCIPGCERFTPLGEGRFETVVVASVGPVRARLNGTVALEDIVVFERYTLRFALQGGAAGFGQGRVRVSLHDEDGGSSIRYTADSVVGGKLAQLGSRLVDGSIRKFSAVFFAQLAEVLQHRGDGAS